MNRMLRTFLVLHAVSPILALAQPVIEWQKCLGGTDWESGQAMVQTTDGGFVVAGYSRSTDGDVSGFQGGSTIGDVWVVKVDALGDIQWQRCLGGSGDEDAKSIQQTTDGGYVLAGSTDSEDGDVSGLHTGFINFPDAWVVKLDTDGNVQWQRCLGGAWSEEATSVQQTADGGYVMAGKTGSEDGDVSGTLGGDDAWVVKLDADGAIQWQKCLGGSASDRARSIRQNEDGGYMVVGNTRSTDGELSGFHGTGTGNYGDAWVAKLNADGTVQWQKCLGGSDDDVAYDVQPTSDGGSIVGAGTWSNDGDVSGNHGGAGDGWVVKLDGAGGIQWQKCVGGSVADYANALQSVDGGYLVGGFTSSGDGDMTGFHGGSDAWLMLLSTDGSIQWNKCMGGLGSEYAYAVVHTTDGGYAIAGGATWDDGDVSGIHGQVDIWLVKLGPAVGINEAEAPPVTVSPNPTFDQVTVAFKADARPLRVDLLDASGRLTMTRPVRSATHSFTLDMSEQECGTYVLQMYFADGTIVVEHIVKE